MRRHFFSFALMGIAALALVSCEPKNTPVDPQPQDTTTVPVDTTVTPTDTITPMSFPKKHLIEEFTGQDCGYCPYGMNCISEFMENDTNFVLILHHYGYQADHFSVSGSKTITNSLSVSGAPSAAINRAKTKTAGGNAIVFHPGYLPGADKSQFAKETYASVNIANTYDAASRELKIHVSGQIGAEHPQLFLTVLVKESGMIDYQSDYYFTYEGWKEFRHCNAVRAFATPAKGDSVHVEKQAYSADYTMTLGSTWVPENCMVVAFLSEGFKPVIQAAELPVVEGTAGGSDIEHGGVTPVPVADYYPEPSATEGPADFSGNTNGETLATASAWYTQYEDYTAWYLQTYSTSPISIDGTQCAPFAIIEFFTAAGTTSFAEGTYKVNSSQRPGTVLAGFRNDEEFEIGGSEFYFVNYSYLQQGYLVPVHQWLIARGTLTIESNKWSLEGRARNGATIKLVGSTAIQNGGRNTNNAPKKMPNRIEKRPYAIEYCK